MPFFFYVLFVNHLNVGRGFITWFSCLLLLIFALNVVELCVQPVRHWPAVSALVLTGDLKKELFFFVLFCFCLLDSSQRRGVAL